MIKLTRNKLKPHAQTFFLLVLSSLFCQTVLAQSVLDNYQNVSLEELTDPPAEDWLMWRRTGDHWGYSPLDQINKENVSSLRLAFAWTMEPGL